MVNGLVLVYHLSNICTHSHMDALGETWGSGSCTSGLKELEIGPPTVICRRPGFTTVAILFLGSSFINTYTSTSVVKTVQRANIQTDSNLLWMINAGDECSVCGYHWALSAVYVLYSFKAWRWSIVQGAGGFSSFFLSSHEIKHWEFILQGVTVVFEGKHCGELHCVLAYKPTG